MFRAVRRDYKKSMVSGSAHHLPYHEYYVSGDIEEWWGDEMKVKLKIFVY